MIRSCAGSAFRLCHCLNREIPIMMASAKGALIAGATAEYHSHDFEFAELEADGAVALGKFAAMTKPDDAATLKAESAYKSWQKFHFAHEGKFFHPRLYATEAFPELLCRSSSDLDAKLATTPASSEGRGLRIFEIGCGNGSNVFPILEKNPECIMYSTDFCPAALKTIVKNPKYEELRRRLHVFLWDVLTDKSPSRPASPVSAARISDSAAISTSSHADWAVRPDCRDMDIVIMMFVASALHPRDHATAFKRATELLRPGGVLAFRDYGVFDAAMMRASEDNVLSPKLHVRGDGTLSYYFDLDEVRSLAVAAGLRVLELEYCTVRNVNRRKGIEMKRVWIHGKFMKI